MMNFKGNINRLFDIADHIACRIGVRHCAEWGTLVGKDPIRLYAGKINRNLPQFHTHFGITPFFASSRNINHDVSNPYPINDESVDVYQSEDVFEHLDYEDLTGVFDEIYRILKPGGLFRLSLPDYNFALYRERLVRDSGGAPLFDPGGGGRLLDGKVVDGGHLWFPTIDNVRNLFEHSAFAAADVRYLQFTADDGTMTMAAIDHSLGNVQRTPEHDKRVTKDPRPISIVVDAWKLSRP